MSKLIIDNRSDLQDEAAILLVGTIIRMGRISNDDKQYCYYTTFSGGKYGVSTDLNAKPDRFVVVNH